LLVAGRSVVLDASFGSDRHRAAARALADDTASELVEIRCTVGEEDAVRRLQERHELGVDASDADPDVAARLADLSDPWAGATELPTARSIDAVLEEAVAIVTAASGTIR
jgi:predicted kinase